SSVPLLFGRDPFHSSTPSLLAILSLYFYIATSPTYIYTLSLHDALPILSFWRKKPIRFSISLSGISKCSVKNVLILSCRSRYWTDRKSTRLNSSHVSISYAVFCLKKKRNSRKSNEHYYEHH